MNTILELASDPKHYAEVRDLILSEQMCPTKVALLYQQRPAFADYMSQHVDPREVSL